MNTVMHALGAVFSTEVNKVLHAAPKTEINWV